MNFAFVPLFFIVNVFVIPNCRIIEFFLFLHQDCLGSKLMS